MITAVQFLKVVSDSNLSWFSFSVGSKFPIMRDTKTYWIINVFGDFEKKVMKSTCRLAGEKDSPQFAIFEPDSEVETLVTVTEKRPLGRPRTGKALSPAEKQARYRARLAQNTVTVTFNRSDIPTLKLLLANAPSELSLPADVLDRLNAAVFDSALSQLTRVNER